MTDPTADPFELQRSLGRVEGSLEGLHSKFDTMYEKHTAFERRIVHVEKRQGWMIGWLAGGAAIGTAILAVLNHLHSIVK